MADIQVVFKTGQRAMVLQDPEAVMQNEILNWHFHTARTPVREVRIVFKRKDATFFPIKGSDPQHELRKKVAHGQTMWGQAPEYFEGKRPRTRPDKYTIEAFDRAGRKLKWATLDPTIRTDGP